IDGPPSPAGDKSQPSAFAISPDGQQIAVVASSGDVSVLWVRSVAGSPWRPLVGTEGAINPFWRPDSQSIGFFARKSDTDRGQVKTVKLADGSVTSLCDLPDNPRPAYGTWNSRGIIVFSSDVFLRQVAESGGVSTPATHVTDPGKDVHRSPSFLPDG